jgi:hypothetical protein
LGFRTAALTFLNQPAVVAIIFQAWRKCGHVRPKTEEAICNFSVVAGSAGIS